MYTYTEQPAEGIQLQRLDIGYAPKHHAPSVVAHALTAQASRGQLTCLIGGNGTGKSTLLRTIAAFQPPLAGQVLVDGQRLDTLTAARRARRVAVVLTAAPHLPHTTVEELAALGRAPYTGFFGRLHSRDRQAVRRALAQVGIGALARRPLHSLSDGERQKALIARALAQQADVLLLDEPTAFLDYPAKASVMVLLRQLAVSAQRTVLLSTHDLDLALQLAHRLWLLTPGGLVQGTPRQLADSGALASFINSPWVQLDPRHLSIQVKAQANIQDGSTQDGNREKNAAT